GHAAPEGPDPLPVCPDRPRRSGRDPNGRSAGAGGHTRVPTVPDRRPPYGRHRPGASGLPDAPGAAAAGQPVDVLAQLLNARRWRRGVEVHALVRVAAHVVALALAAVLVLRVHPALRPDREEGTGLAADLVVRFDEDGGRPVGRRGSGQPRDEGPAIEG